MKLVYKVLTPAEWEDATVRGTFLGSAADLRDGFMHFSTAEQAEETVARHFSGAGELFLVAVDAKAFGSAMRWEPSRGEAMFPHLYEPLRLSDIIWTKPFDAQQADGLRELLTG